MARSDTRLTGSIITMIGLALMFGDEDGLAPGRSDDARDPEPAETVDPDSTESGRQ